MDFGKVTIGVKVFSGGKCTHRERIGPERITWENDGDARRGKVSFDVPYGAVVQSLAAYCGVTQHQYWFRDLARAQNDRTVAYKAIDPKAARLRDFLFEEENQRRAPAPNFEQGVATLLHLLGFSVLHIGTTRRLADAPDIL